MEKQQGNHQERTLSAWLYRFMEERAPWFWGIFSVVMVLILYKTFNVAFLEKTPYVWDGMFQHVTLSLLCIILMREAYKGEFQLGFRTAGFWQGLLLCWPAYLFIALNLFVNLGSGRIYIDSLLMTLMDYCSVGLFEEVVIRAILVGHMMHHWKNDPRRISKTVIWSSVIFGVLHIGNFFSNPLGTVMQIFYATGLGLLFAAAYIRTRNLWCCILIHSIIDFCGAIPKIFVPLQADMAAYNASLEQVPQLILSRMPEETLMAIAPLLQLMPLVLALLAAVAAIYMLRPKKHSRINILWENLSVLPDHT